MLFVLCQIVTSLTILGGFFIGYASGGIQYAALAVFSSVVVTLSVMACTADNEEGIGFLLIILTLLVGICAAFGGNFAFTAVAVLTAIAAFFCMWCIMCSDTPLFPQGIGMLTVQGGILYLIMRGFHHGISAVWLHALLAVAVGGLFIGIPHFVPSKWISFVRDNARAFFAFIGAMLIVPLLCCLFAFMREPGDRRPFEWSIFSYAAVAVSGLWVLICLAVGILWIFYPTVCKKMCARIEDLARYS